MKISPPSLNRVKIPPLKTQCLGVKNTPMLSCILINQNDIHEYNNRGRDLKNPNTTDFILLKLAYILVRNF